jgi:putative membrane protein
MFPDLFLQNAVTMSGGGFFIRILVIALLCYVATKFLSGITVKNFTSAVILSVVLSLLSATVGWLLSALAVPIDFLSFGLFSGIIVLVINAIVIKIADGFMSSFSVKNFWWALALALILSVGTGLFNVQFGVSM